MTESQQSELSLPGYLQFVSQFDRFIETLSAWKKVLLLVAIGLQFSVLGSLLVIQAVPHWFGEPIRVKVIPIDPRSLFRGDYVILSYEFSRLNKPLRGQPEESKHEWLESQRGEPIFALLVPESDGIRWRVDEFSLTRPTDSKYLTGRITSYNRIEYGIESYFVQEGKGKQIEKAIRNKQVDAEIMVTADGQAAVNRLVIED